MTDKEALQLTEQCLYDYPANLTRIEVLRKDLLVLRAGSDVKAQNYLRVLNDDDVKKGSMSDPVFNFVTKIEKLEEEIERLRRITEPISNMIRDLKTPYATDASLNSDFIKILGLDYFARNPVAVILDSTKWSRAGFFRKKKQLILLAKKYLGY